MGLRMPYTESSDRADDLTRLSAKLWVIGDHINPLQGAVSALRAFTAEAGIHGYWDDQVPGESAENLRHHAELIVTAAKKAEEIIATL